MDIKIKLKSEDVMKLLSCKETSVRNIKHWDVDRLLKEAINEFTNKYGRKNTKTEI